MSNDSTRSGTTTSVESVLRECALNALPSLLDSGSGLVSRGRRLGPDGWLTDPPTLRDSAEVCHALACVATRGLAVPIDPSQLRDACRKRAESEDPGVDDLCWLLRAEVATGGGRADDVGARLLRGWPRDETRTLRLSWGLLAALDWRALARDTREIEAFIGLVRRRIAGNQTRSSGLFRPSATRRGWRRRLPAEASLATQAWALAALLAHHRTFRDDDSLHRAQGCVRTIVSAQGDGGEWWWKYDVRSGTVIERYPVYSVQQDAAMPAVLRELDRASGETRFEEPARRGLEWVVGRNELGRSLLLEPEAVICRGVEAPEGRPRVLSEMRSYHPARCLLALTPERSEKEA